MRPVHTGFGLGFVVLALGLASAAWRGAPLDDHAEELDAGADDAAVPLDATIDVDPEPGEPIDDDASTGDDAASKGEEEDGGSGGGHEDEPDASS